MVPDVTVVIPVYNDPVGIKRTLDSLLQQPAAELIVVDNGSTDQTSKVVKSYDDDRITLLHERDIQSSYAARNTGIQHADTGIIAFVDADMTVSEDWLASVSTAFEDQGADYMGCHVELALPERPTLAARYDHHTGFPIQQYLKTQQFVPTCCLVVRRDVFRDVGLFDHRLISGGDKEFGNRVHAAGYKLAYTANATLHHPTRNTLASLLSKDLRVGRGLCQLQRYHPDRYGQPGIPPRPSGIKRPEQKLPIQERLTFGAISRMLTGVRGLGYYREYFAETQQANLSGIPHLKE